MKALETSDTCEIEYFGIMQTLVTQKLSIRVLNAPCAYDAQRLYVHFGPNQKFLTSLVPELWPEIKTKVNPS